MTIRNDDNANLAWLNYDQREAQREREAAMRPLAREIPNVQPLPWTPEARHDGLWAILDANGIAVCSMVTEDEARLICQQMNLLAVVPPPPQELKKEEEDRSTTLISGAEVNETEARNKQRPAAGDRDEREG